MHEYSFSQILKDFLSFASIQHSFIMVPCDGMFAYIAMVNLGTAGLEFYTVHGVDGDHSIKH